MDKNQVIGFILLFAVLLGWTVYNAPSEEEIKASQARQDSIAALKEAQETNITLEADTTAQLMRDSSIQSINTPTNQGENIVLANDDIEITISTLGGGIQDVWLKEYKRYNPDSIKDDVLEPLHLMNDKKKVFEYLINDPVSGGVASTKNVAFTPSLNGNTLTLRGNFGGGTLEQTYVLAAEGYHLDYNVKVNGLSKLTDDNPLELHWVEYINKIEKNQTFEQRYSTVYYKENDSGSADYCSCTSDDEEDVSQPIDWVAYSNQFFNTTLLSRKTPFLSADLKTVVLDLEKGDHVKKVESRIQLPLVASSASHDMEMYLGPNEFQTLRDYDISLEHIIPYGNSIFGTINRWLIRPFFNFLHSFISSKGLTIILLIFLIKMLLYPLMYKMLHSQALMGALKPELAGIKEKYKDDTQKQQMETMKVYREYGVSPFGGCLPMLLQMPIWYAMFRFFPAAITFRQESFLWASDLASYDNFFQLPFEIPFMGDHLSLFTILWALATIVYTYYNTQNMDMSANPAMKYMQYFMPLMFLGFFNTYAAGLTCYMFFSNLINIVQTIGTKKFVFNENKLRAELQRKKSKPKKKSSFQQRLEEAMKQQQAIQEKRNKK